MEVHSCKAWDRTKASSEGNGGKSSEESGDSESEDDLEFADEAVSVLMRKFEVPLENAGVTYARVRVRALVCARWCVRARSCRLRLR